MNGNDNDGRPMKIDWCDNKEVPKKPETPRPKPQTLNAKPYAHCRKQQEEEEAEKERQLQRALNRKLKKQEV